MGGEGGAAAAGSEVEGRASREAGERPKNPDQALCLLYREELTVSSGEAGAKLQPAALEDPALGLLLVQGKISLVVEGAAAHLRTRRARDSIGQALERLHESLALGRVAHVVGGVNLNSHVACHDGRD